MQDSSVYFSKAYDVGSGSRDVGDWLRLLGGEKWKSVFVRKR